MGYLADGIWHTGWYTPDKEGRFVRQTSRFRHRIERDPKARFPAEPQRYHLYVSYACPWAHRTLIARRLKRLENVISVSVVDFLMSDDGWFFSERAGATPDHVNGARFLREIYVKADPKCTGRVTVPVLWDKVSGTIVNNESRDILEMFDAAFASLGDGDDTVALYPPGLEKDVNAAIDANYEAVNNGVYKAGFASSQSAYEEAANELFEAFGRLEDRLSRSRFLCGSMLTAADICLFTTLVRFDHVYHGHFKCNRRRLIDYPNLFAYVRDIYQTDGVRDTVRFDHIVRHYYESHTHLNPSGIYPIGPDIDFAVPHQRASL